MRLNGTAWDNRRQVGRSKAQKISTETTWDSMRRHGTDTDSMGQGETAWDIGSRSGSFLRQLFTEGRVKRRL